MSATSKGGVIALSSGDKDRPGPTVILRNSTFESNRADLGEAGVVYLGEHSSVIVAGDGNVFVNNRCNDNGAVLGGTHNTSITVEGGVFRNNVADEVGGYVSFVKTVMFCMIFATLTWFLLNKRIAYDSFCDWCQQQ